MEENNGLPVKISEIGDGQHVVLINPILEIPSHLGPYLRRPAKIERGYFYGVTAILVLLGTHPGQNQAIPMYYRICRGDLHLPNKLQLLTIKEGKTIVTSEGKVIEIF